MNNLLTFRDDVLLLQRVTRRDRDAFFQLYDRYSGILYSTILRVLNNPVEADDILKEVFLQIWDKASTYDPLLGKPFNWALALARQRAIDRLRSLKRHHRFLEEVTGEIEESGGAFASIPDDVFTPEPARSIRAAVSALPLEQRQAIEMAFLGGLTHHEIAADLGQPPETVKAHIRQGMLQLRDALRGTL